VTSPGSGGRITLERATALILDRARVLYYRWPEVDDAILP
jgi:hypothetical protein